MTGIPCHEVQVDIEHLLHYGLAATLIMVLSYLLALAMAALPSSNQGLTPEMRADIDRQIGFQRSWEGRANSPGAELEAVDVTPNSAKSGAAVMYELKAKGLPQDLDYELLHVDTMASRPEEIQSEEGFRINQDGRVVDQAGDPFHAIIPAAAPGEPYRFAIASADGKNRAFITVLPNPIESSDKGCKLRVIRLMPRFELAFVQMTGFPPTSNVAFHGDSDGEIHEGAVKIDDKGYADLGILPFKQGKSKGSMEIRVSSPSCAPKVKFSWGTTH